MFECHITIDPVPADRREFAENLARCFSFKLAKLYMDKGVPSQKDTFMTGHDQKYDVMEAKMYTLVKALQDNGFKVRRYKIEHIILDSKYQGDPLNIL